MLLITKLANKNKRPWADLPPEILETIMERLCFEDQIRFRAVCRSWRLHGVKPNIKFPWLLMYNENDTYRSDFPMRRYCLYNPSSGKSYIVKNKVKHKCEWNKKFRSVHIECLAVRSGWLLLGYRCCRVIFLYNAFTQKIVSLNLYRTDWLCKHTSSYCPQRREFMVYAVRRDIKKLVEIVIHSWRTGEKYWNSLRFGMGGNKMPYFALEGTRETLYCVFANGMVGAFKGKNWTMLVDSKSIRSSELETRLIIGFNINNVCCECEGELFLVLRNFGQQIKWIIFRLDRDTRRWVKEDGLGKRALFSSMYPLCSWPSYAIMFSTLEEQKRDFAGHIFYDNGDNNSLRFCFFRCNKAPGAGDDIDQQFQQYNNTIWACRWSFKVLGERLLHPTKSPKAFWIHPSTL